MNQRWRARWTTRAGIQQEYHFISLSSRVIARIDLWLKLTNLGYAIPDEVTLEEDDAPERERGITWDRPIILKWSGKRE